MKTKLLTLLFLLTLVAVGPFFAKDIGLDITTTTAVAAGSPTPTPTTANRAKYITFIFDTSFVGTVAGACFAGTANVCRAGAPADQYFTVPVPSGDALMGVPYSVSAGSVRIIRAQ